MVPLDSLNENQRRAAAWDEGPVLVLAGPGSGKTFVLTTRVARLLEASRGKQFRVLGLTFTTRAADEMRKRVDGFVPALRDRAHLSTFHSFAAELLRQHGSAVGLDPAFTILAERQARISALAEAMHDLEKPRPSGPGIAIDRAPKDIIGLLDHRFAQGYDAAPASLGKLPYWLSPLFDRYLEILRERSQADYESLLWFCHELLAKRPAVARDVRIIYKFVCVDEFQDTNTVQYKLLKAIVGPAPANLFIVADDDQILYQWNGASPERFHELNADYAPAVIQLPENYRCPADVIGLANALIRHNHARSEGKLPLVAKRAPNDVSSYRVYRFEADTDELAWIGADILHRALPPTDCVILARTNRLLIAAEEALLAQGISAHVVRRKSAFESAPFRWLHAALRLANERHDAEQLRRICKAWFELSASDIRPNEVEVRSALVGGDFLRAWVEMARDAVSIDMDGMQMLDVLQRDLVDRNSMIAFLPNARRWMDGLHTRLGGQDDRGFSEYPDEKRIWDELYPRILRHIGADPSLHEFLQELDLEPKVPPPPQDAVRCMTVHGSKGLEFEHVYLIGMAEDILPSFQARRRGDNSREMEEERRNCFVALTRVKTSLTMTLAKRYGSWNRKASRFLAEMGLGDA